MRKNAKRLCSLLLAVVLVCSTLPVSFANQHAIPYAVEKTIMFNGHTYIRFDESMNWADAKAACEQMGGYLATITSSEEQSSITTLVTAGSHISYWVGATDEQQEPGNG